MSIPRGIRNNNPGNIRISRSRWKGKIADNTDGAFEQFKTKAHGVRAMIIVIRNYIKRHKLETIPDIVNRFAPPHENDTTMYYNYVANKANISLEDRISRDDKETLKRMIIAMTELENGQGNGITECDFEDAWKIL